MGMREVALRPTRHFKICSNVSTVYASEGSMFEGPSPR